MIKVKVKPEDFVVEEIADLPLKKTGNFCVYLLKKKGWNTIDVLNRLSKRFNIPFSDFSYGGRKDKYALTSQYITIARQGYKQTTPPVSPPSQGGDERGVKKPWVRHRNSRFPSMVNSAEIEKLIPTKLDKENYSLSFVDLMDRPMGPDLIKGNKFTITIRNLTEDDLTLALSEIDTVKQYGYPNYFDDQRFGSYDTRQGFVAEKILKKHYNGALKIYFTHIRPEDSKEEKSHKRRLSENWGTWQLCLEMARPGFEKEAFEYLKGNPKGFIPVLQRISYEEMSLFFSAYQSYLWNDLLRRIIQSISRDVLKISRGMAGDYLFYNHLDDKDNKYLKKLYIPTPASNIRMPDTFTASLYSKVLKDNNLKASMFNIRKLRQAFFKGTERKAIIIPEDLSVDSSGDEIYRGRKTLTLKFFLPRGCYGTMLIKRLFTVPKLSALTDHSQDLA